MVPVGNGIIDVDLVYKVRVVNSIKHVAMENVIVAVEIDTVP